MKKQFEINLEDSAKHQGSGDNIVLSTPRLVAYMENVAKSMITESSVGYKMDIKHIAPTPIGALITIDCNIVKNDDRRYEFQITASDCVEKIAEATHVRYIIDSKKFQNKVDTKMLGKIYE